MRWRRLDEPGSEDAHVEQSSDGWCLTGQVDVQDSGVSATLRYRIDCDLDWRTRFAVIEGVSGGQRIRFDLAVHDGLWTRDGRPLPELSGALDIDLGFTPATNTLPIRRLGLAVGETAAVKSAWLRFPELQLEMLEQTYTREAEHIYRYVADVDGAPFIARLDTDRYGRVLCYENLWAADGGAT
jgi:hypothetical protein